MYFGHELGDFHVALGFHHFHQLPPPETWPLAYLASLHEIGDHHDDPDFLLPDHSPEGAERGRQRPLGGDVGTRALEAVNEVGVDVVAALLTGQRT